MNRTLTKEELAIVKQLVDQKRREKLSTAGRYMTGAVLDCAYCGNAFDRRANGQRYCSLTCKYRYAQAKRTGAPVYGPGSDNRRCMHCGKGYTAKQKHQRYCSRRCKKLVDNAKANKKAALRRKEQAG